jgi:hypothetical protein
MSFPWFIYYCALFGGWAARAGRYTLRVKSSNGSSQSQKVTITSTSGILD